MAWSRGSSAAVADDRPVVRVVGLGPAGPELTTPAAASVIEEVRPCFLRTARHPAAAAVTGAVALDGVYDDSPSLESVYPAIVEILVDAAARHGRIAYAVPGSPLVAERSVELLLADTRVRTEVLPALSFLDLAWSALGVDPVAAGVRLVDGRGFASAAAGERGPLLVAQCDSPFVLGDIKLAVEDPPAAPVTLLARLGLPDQSVRQVRWEDLDRDVQPDHLTSLYVPEVAAPVAVELVRFAELVRTLRESCPWDREQTHQSLTRHLVEEAYEVVEAVGALDPAEESTFAHLEEELGDLLFQVVFHSTLAAEGGRFNLADVARRVHDKLVSRHPHVFGTVEARTAAEVLANWEQIKQVEKGRSSLMDGIPGDLPALLYAHKVQRKVASAGFGIEPLASGADGSGIGRRLFDLVAEARRLGIDPEGALRTTAAEVRQRFEALERLAARRGTALSELGEEDLRSVGAGRPA